jgi:hypothetical protein
VSHRDDGLDRLIGGAIDPRSGLVLDGLGLSLAYSFLPSPESISSELTTTSVRQCRLPASSSHLLDRVRLTFDRSEPYEPAGR